MSDAPITIELNPREQRLYDRLRSRVISSEPGSASGMKDLLFLLPDLTVLLMRMLRDSDVPVSSKAIALMGVGYALSPIDLLPSILLGPIGLVDDLLVVSAALSRLVNTVHPDVVRRNWSGQGDVLDVIQRTSKWSETFVSQRLAGLFRLPRFR